MKRATKIIIVTAIAASTLGGIAYAKSGCGMHGPQQVVRGLDLNEQQQANFQAVIEQFRSNRKEMRAQRQQRRDEMLSLLNSDKLDQTRALGMLESKTNAINARAPEMVSTIARFTDSLTPEQRHQLRERIGDRMDFMLKRMRHFGAGQGYED
jgi:Spy/CpxP family protein refolding chaperone